MSPDTGRGPAWHDEAPQTSPTDPMTSDPITDEGTGAGERAIEPRAWLAAVEASDLPDDTKAVARVLVEHIGPDGTLPPGLLDDGPEGTA